MHIRATLSLLVTSFWFPSALAAGYGDKTTYSVNGNQIKTRRERNLDHWDSDTLAYYLDDYRGHDIAIMFYAQWDRNSHALAPYWDQIATKLDAGNTKSRLIMSLFDCELNVAHIELCKALNIEAYPTILFVGSGPYHDTDPITKSIFGKKSTGIMGEAPVRNTVKFQGNWQYTDSILDWIRTMQALSNWHIWTTEGFGRRLRNFLLPRASPNKPLPIGVPGSSSHGSSAERAGNSATIQVLEQQVETLVNRTKEVEKNMLRETRMLNNLLLPSSDQDMFEVLNKEKIWDSVEKKTANVQQQVLQSCTSQISLYYCQRVSTKVATDLVNELEASGKSVEEMLQMDTLEQDVLDRVSKEEPYCGILDQCVLNDFRGEVCRPTSCPFKNDIACRYVTSCFDAELQKEFAEALGLSLVELDASTLAITENGKKTGWSI
jgi:hypothetical protein